MELLLEFVLTVSLSFMFAFLFTKLISMNSTADDPENDNSELKSDREYLIEKSAVNEHYFSARSRSKTCDEIEEEEEVINVDRFQRVSLLEKQINFAECAIEGKGSVELSQSNYIGQAAVGEYDCKEIMVVELDENTNEFSFNSAEFSVGRIVRPENDGDFEEDNLFVQGSTTSSRSQRRRFCQVEIELVEDEFSEGETGKREEEIEVLDCEGDKAMELDDWEAIERKDFEEVLSNNDGELEIGNAKV